MNNETFRVAVVSTPRVGNTWINYCLADITGAPSIGLHRFADIDGLSLPPKLILQIHAEYQDKPFHDFIKNNNFQVITVVRHPMDVLISMLRFMQVQASPLQWLDGKAGTAELYGVDPSEQKFVDWCLSEGASKLLNISYDWAKSGEVHTIRYEDMLKEPVKHMEELASELGLNTTTTAINAALKKFDPAYFKNNANQHSWQASKDNWMNFFTKDDAAKIYAKHKVVFDYFGYGVKGVHNTSRKQNLAQWDQKTNAKDLHKVYFQEIQNLDARSKRLIIEALNLAEARTHEINELHEKLRERDEELASARKLVSELETWLGNITPLKKHVKLSIQNHITGVRKTK